MKIIKTLTCKTCKIELSIQENSFIVSESKTIEKAHCVKCETEIYQGQTDGWFFVEIIEEEKNATQQCIYPMP